MVRPGPPATIAGGSPAMIVRDTVNVLLRREKVRRLVEHLADLPLRQRTALLA